MIGMHGHEQLFFFHDYSVALKYNYRIIGNTTITLFWDKDKISEVEKIVLSESKK